MATCAFRWRRALLDVGSDVSHFVDGAQQLRDQTQRLRPLQETTARAEHKVGHDPFWGLEKPEESGDADRPYRRVRMRGCLVQVVGRQVGVALHRRDDVALVRLQLDVFAARALQLLLTHACAHTRFMFVFIVPVRACECYDLQLLKLRLHFGHAVLGSQRSFLTKRGTR